jgi:glycosyltransferase involved in cell wall biosynthesis
VTFTGRIPYPDAPKYLALGDIAVAPKLSATEGAGKLLNYMAVGLPTVAFDTPVAREYLGLDGLLARRGDVESLAEELAACLYPEESRTPVDRMKRQLRQRAARLFGWDLAGRQIESTFDVLVSIRNSAQDVSTVAVARKTSYSGQNQ